MGLIYHITTQKNWQQAMAKGIYDFDSLQSEGFIHCSFLEQIEKVANSHFKGDKDLILLEIEEEDVFPSIKHENLEGGEELFPHIYGALNIQAVINVFELKKGPDGKIHLPPELTGV